ncbi:MAG TPA: glycosyltransferase, partial [Rhodospirillales bacterium]|nr:glycosyltransferase [Rhodospirillales bacterium]
MTAAGTAPLVVLAAGGTGGHVFPAEALAAELIGRGAALMLFTDRRGDVYGGTLGGLDSRTIRAGGIAGKGLLARARSLADLALGSLQARRLLKKLSPRAVVGFGG